MAKEIMKLLLGVICFLSGGALFEVAFTESDSIGAIIGTCFCGLIMMVGGALLFFMNVSVIRDFKMKKAKLKDELFLNQTAKKSETENEFLIENFRNDYEEYFALKGNKENSKIQDTASQILWNMVRLHDERLSSKGLVMKLKTTRMNYGFEKEVREKSHFEGQYKINEIEEDIHAETEIFNGTKSVYKRVNKDIAKYVVTEVNKVGADKVTCPNCGAVTTRSNLIDGCDYCGTVFKVEDLGKRVNAFALRKDYKVEYQRYKQVRKKMMVWAGLIVGAIALIFSAIGTLYTFFTEPSLHDEGIFLTAVSMLLTTLCAAGMFGFLGAYFFMIFIFPWIQGGASLEHLSKKTLESLKSAEYRDNGSQNKVREHDPGFSISNFYVSVQNKLATMFYANNEKEINAFVEDGVDLSKYLSNFRNIVDMDVENIVMDSYVVDSELQRARVRLEVKLVSTNGNTAKCTTSHKKIRLELVKNVDAKLQEICEPSVLHCKGCGQSLSLLDGRECKYCGRKLDLKQHDFVISQIQF